MMNQSPFKLHSAYVPTGDQPEAIDSLVANLEAGVPEHRKFFYCIPYGKC